jgi:hypothetical protein
VIVHADITDEEKHELKRIALDRRVPMTKLLGDLIRGLIAENGKKAPPGP